ncbi:MAG: DUF2809 domain-containing protein [Clostridia bacterium]|nr:DUF2809 domain-containing protein [Clostridia bacterium]
MKKPKLVYALLFFAVFVLEVLIALFVNDSFIRPFGGDILVTVLLCLFVRAFFPVKTKLLPVYVFLFAVAVEICQYFDVVKLLGFENNVLISTIVGRSYSFIDIICYGVGCVAFFIIEQIFIKKMRYRYEHKS